MSAPYQAPGFLLAREEDAALFEDWSAGRDEHGLWLWIDAPARVLIVRPAGAPDAGIVSRLGGVQQRVHGRLTPDWHVPLSRWRALHAALPRLIQIRQRILWERAIRNRPSWTIIQLRMRGVRSIATYSQPDRIFAAEARAAGARFGTILDRAGWWLPVDAPTHEQFCAAVGRSAARDARAL